MLWTNRVGRESLDYLTERVVVNQKLGQWQIRVED